MTRIILACILVLACNVALAQEPTEGKTEFQKKDQPAAVIELPYPPDVVEDAIKGYLTKKGVKGNSSKGVQIFKGTKLSDLDLSNSDLYFKVERKSRKEKDASVVYLFVTKENESPGARIDGDNYGVEGAKSFLKDMLPSIEAHNLEVDISGQEAALKKAERKYDNLTDEAKDLEKRMKKLEDNIEENKRDIEKQRIEVENQRRILETMRAKRKS
ncbi:MAG TPA: hypothetical protein VJT83_09205 [Chitinophagaceae bacterium]|nr:hypothetical protein [Chitinophagaceae bacterium]